MWSESMFAHLRAITSMTSEKCLLSIKLVDLVEGVSIWGVPGLEMDSFVHEVRTFDHHLPPCGKVNEFEAILICIA
jgi:hypothetical protein